LEHWSVLKPHERAWCDRLVERGHHSPAGLRRRRGGRTNRADSQASAENWLLLPMSHPRRTPAWPVRPGVHRAAERHTIPKSGIRCHPPNQFRHQAYWVGAAALLPRRVLKGAVTRGVTVADLATQCEVSQDLVGFRERVLGLRLLRSSLVGTAQGSRVRRSSGP
jgi:hypothetical protein